VLNTAARRGDNTSFVIWCDFGGVISAGLGRALDEVARQAGLPWPDIARAAATVADRMGLSGLQPLELGLMTQNEWGSSVADELAASTEAREVLCNFDRHYYRTRTLDQELLDGLERLRSDGVQLGMLTNSVLEWEPHRQRLLSGRPQFDYYLRSHEVGLAKPDPAIYALADSVLGVREAERVLIDDLAVNCAAAAASGWRTILHVDAPTTLAQLHRLVNGEAV
jgi:putative hydrolase of the HAD superfamily